MRELSAFPNPLCSKSVERLAVLVPPQITDIGDWVEGISIPVNRPAVLGSWFGEQSRRSTSSPVANELDPTSHGLARIPCQEPQEPTRQLAGTPFLLLDEDQSGVRTTHC